MYGSMKSQYLSRERVSQQQGSDLQNKEEKNILPYPWSIFFDARMYKKKILPSRWSNFLFRCFLVLHHDFFRFFKYRVNKSSFNPVNQRFTTWIFLTYAT